MLRIAFDNLLYLALISELLENFIKENPDCGVSLLTGTSKHIIHKLKADEIDFGFIAAEYDDNFYEGYHSVTLLFMQGKTVFGTLVVPVLPLESGKYVQVSGENAGCILVEAEAGVELACAILP